MVIQKLTQVIVGLCFLVNFNIYYFAWLFETEFQQLSLYKSEVRSFERL